MALPWRNCHASTSLVAEVDARWPARDRASDGTIGDASHSSRTSDHNLTVKVDNLWIVRARDTDRDGIDAPWLAEYLRTLGAAGDPRLRPGGYIIFNRRITTPDFSGWRTYTGTNPHVSHVHVSFAKAPAGFDLVAPWGIAGEDWFAMATAADLEAVLSKVIDQKLGSGVYDYRAHHCAPEDNAVGQVLSIRRDLHGGLDLVLQKLDDLISVTRAAGVDPAAVQQALVQAFAGGLTVTSTIAPAPRT